MNEDFFKEITGFSQFAELTDRRHYTPAPEDWDMVLCDVRHSTEAIAAGKYKEVNLVGASAIMAILNISDSVSLPYVFGGDGATILTPARLTPAAIDALRAVQAKIFNAFGLELRVGHTPLAALYAKGARLEVGKFDLSPHISQAMFQGNAISLAEEWLKKGGGPIQLCQADHSREPDLQGLECRWQPIENRNGEMLSLLVRVSDAHAEHGWDIYRNILDEIHRIYPEGAQANPMRSSGMQLNLWPGNLRKEALLRGGATWQSRLGYVLRTYIYTLIGHWCIKTGKQAGTFDGSRYLSELVLNSDVKKFDEMLRMVLDSTQAQSTALKAMLEKKRDAGQIAYGLHSSPQALMTCLVFGYAGNHVHFIDGADGGYALAAKQMKQQLALGAQTS